MTDLFTPKELRDIAARASNIDERLAGGYVADNTPMAAENAARRMEAWCKSATDGDPVLFHKRLARDGLTIDAVKPLLGDIRLSENRPIPAWIDTFIWAVETMRSPGSAYMPVRFIDPSRPLPFEELFVPLVVAARERCDKFTGDSSSLLSETAYAALQRGFLQRLSELCAPMLYEGFSVFQMLQQPMMMVFTMPSDGDPGSRGVYDAYTAEVCAGGWRDFFLNRPVLGWLLATVTQQWIDVTVELVTRLDTDLGAICQTFNSGSESGPVTEIDHSLSDPHNNGRTVCILTFSSGLKVVYKPKDLGFDVAWANLLHWFNQQGAPISLRAPTVLNRQGFGWVEWIAPVPCTDETDACRFFRRAGAILCLVHFLQGTDVHFENIIANSDQPVLVDLETLMHPWLANPFSEDSPNSALAAAAERLRESVLATGFLPN